MAGGDMTTAMDPVRQLLLSRITGQGPATAGLSLPDLVEQQLGDDPIAGPLAAALRQRTAAAELAEPDVLDQVIDDEVIPEFGPPEQDPVTEFGPADDAGAIAVLNQMYAELEVHPERNDLLADALGACPVCWGEDGRCPRCRGRGRPGGRRPDPEAFQALVVPAVRRYAAGRPSPPTSTQSPASTVPPGPTTEEQR